MVIAESFSSRTSVRNRCQKFILGTFLNLGCTFLTRFYTSRSRHAPFPWRRCWFVAHFGVILGLICQVQYDVHHHEGQVQYDVHHDTAVGSRITNSRSMLESAYLVGVVLAILGGFLKIPVNFDHFFGSFFLFLAFFGAGDTVYSRRISSHDV